MDEKNKYHCTWICYCCIWYHTCANAHVYSTQLWLNILIMLLGVILFAVGTGFYASASLGRGSYEAVTFSLRCKA